MRPIRYQVLGSLRAGEGSRAQLGLALTDDGRAEPCVIVFVPDEAEKDPTLLAKIQRETEHAAQLDHPNIVTVFGFARLQEGHARVVEFADGESLRRVLNVARTLPPRIATRVVIDACTGVHYAHLAGNDDGTPLVHGDVRPETVLLSFSGVTKVTGYGALAFAPREVGGQRVKGRRVHSSPEQIIGGRDAITIPSDVYLLGLTLYELLTGVVPWADQGEGFDQAVLAYPLPPATPGLIPEALWPVLEKATQKKAALRYPTPLALREAIEAAVGPADIASTGELSAFLEGLFPESSEVRAERKRTLDAGIAEFARQQWARRDTKQIPAVQPVPPPPPPADAEPIEPISEPVRPVPPPPPAPSAPIAPSKPPEAKPKPAPRQAVPEDDEEEPRRDGSSTPWVVFLLVIVVAASGYFAWTRANAPFEPKRTADDVPAPVTASPVDAGAPPAEAPTAATARDPEVPGASDAGQPPPDAGIASSARDAGPALPAEGQVTIESRPPLELSIDGVVVGRTPWTGRLPLGPRKIKLENKELLLSATRTLIVQGDQPITQSYSFEKGTVTVTAPPGASIFIDGKKQGVAPLPGELSIYEGFHRILVKVGQAQWTETFTLYEGQRVNFNVELE